VDPDPSHSCSGWLIYEGDPESGNRSSPPVRRNRPRYQAGLAAPTVRGHTNAQRVHGTLPPTNRRAAADRTLTNQSLAVVDFPIELFNTFAVVASSIVGLDSRFVSGRGNSRAQQFETVGSHSSRANRPRCHRTRTTTPQSPPN